MADSIFAPPSSTPPAAGSAFPIPAPAAATPAEDPNTATAKLRAWEDNNLGKKAVRIHGRVERGYGSKFRDMSPEKQAEHAALEKLVEAEAEVDHAAGKLAAAKAAHEAAKANVVAAGKASDAAAEEARKAEAEDARIAADEAKANPPVPTPVVKQPVSPSGSI